MNEKIPREKKKTGIQSKLPWQTIEYVLKLHDEGATQREIADKVKLSVGVVNKYLKKYSLKAFQADNVVYDNVVENELQKERSVKQDIKQKKKQKGEQLKNECIELISANKPNPLQEKSGYSPFHVIELSNNILSEAKNTYIERTRDIDAFSGELKDVFLHYSKLFKETENPEIKERTTAIMSEIATRLNSFGNDKLDLEEQRARIALTIARTLKIVKEIGTEEIVRNEITKADPVKVEALLKAFSRRDSVF